MEVAQAGKVAMRVETSGRVARVVAAREGGVTAEVALVAGVMEGCVVEIVAVSLGGEIAEG